MCSSCTRLFAKPLPEECSDVSRLGSMAGETGASVQALSLSVPPSLPLSCFISLVSCFALAFTLSYGPCSLSVLPLTEIVDIMHNVAIYKRGEWALYFGDTASKNESKHNGKTAFTMTILKDCHVCDVELCNFDTPHRTVDRKCRLMIGSITRPSEQQCQSV